MLTQSELNYVNRHNFPYPGDDYALAALLKVKESLKQYQDYYKSREYEMTFSDGFSIKFEIIESNVAHMLGVKKPTTNDIPEIDRALVGINKPKSYAYLELISENPKDFIKLNKQYDNQLFNFFRINVRNQVFQKFSNFYDLNFGCVHFNPEILEDRDATTMKSRTFLFTESYEIHAPYFMIGIAEIEEGKPFIETLFPNLFGDKMFRNQVITLPTSLLVTTPTDFRQINPTPKQKLDLFRRLRNDLAQYNSYFDFAFDYESMLADQAKEESKQLIRG